MLHILHTNKIIIHIFGQKILDQSATTSEYQYILYKLLILIVELMH